MLMNVLFFLSANVRRHFKVGNEHSPAFWWHFRGTPVGELLNDCGDDIYDVVFGSEEGRLRTIDLGLCSESGSGFDPELPTLVLCGAGKETWVNLSDPDVAYLGGANGRYGSAVIVPPGIEPEEVVHADAAVRFSGRRAIGMWRERNSDLYHIVTVPKNAVLEKPAWPMTESDAVAALDDSEADFLGDGHPTV